MSGTNQNDHGFLQIISHAISHFLLQSNLRRQVTVDAAQISLRANWNESKSKNAVYEPPAGFKVLRADRIEKHKYGRVSASLDVENNRVTHHALVRGSGDWTNKKRGSYRGLARITLIRA